MKNRKFIKALGSTVLTASLCITGCSLKAEETSKETEKETTTATTTEDECDECDPCGCEFDEDDEIYYSGSFSNSSNGELPEQMDYMVPTPDWEGLDWDNYPADDFTTDLSSIEDDDIRAMAQSYMDDGYQIHDPEIYQEYGNAWGDGEYMFTTGFSAYRDDGTIEECIDAYKMNEDLFNFFFVEMFGYDEDDVRVTDDGTIIRYGEDDDYVEYNRDTGIGFSYSSWDSSYGVG